MIYLYKDPKGEKMFEQATSKKISGNDVNANIHHLAATMEEGGTWQQQVEELKEALQERDAVIAQLLQRCDVNSHGMEV